MLVADGPVIKVCGLVKEFARFRAVDGFDLRVQRGEVHGFLGPNGAGRSTTLRVLLGLYRRSAGTVSVLGLDPATHPAAVTRQVSYVPGEVALWPSLSGQEVLDALAGIRGAYEPAREKRLVADFALDTRRKIRTYSKGNRQKVLLIAAFAAHTDLLVLDEPTSGLDPLMEELFQRCVRDAVADGRTVLLSSHLLDEVERLCGQSPSSRTASSCSRAKSPRCVTSPRPASPRPSDLNASAGSALPWLLSGSPPASPTRAG